MVGKQAYISLGSVILGSKGSLLDFGIQLTWARTHCQWGTAARPAWGYVGDMVTFYSDTLGGFLAGEGFSKYTCCLLLGLSTPPEAVPANVTDSVFRILPQLQYGALKALREADGDGKAPEGKRDREATESESQSEGGGRAGVRKRLEENARLEAQLNAEMESKLEGRPSSPMHAGSALCKSSS